MTGVLAATIQEAVRLVGQMRQDGVTPEQCDTALEQMVRRVWPFERDWKYLCTSCNDSGLVIGQCPGDATCGRAGRAHLPHDYGTPCWCDKGKRFRAPSRGGETDLATVAKTRKPTRWGGR